MATTKKTKPAGDVYENVSAPSYTSGSISSAVYYKAGNNAEVAREAQRLAMLQGKPNSEATQMSLIGAAEKSLVAGGAGYYQDGVYTTKTAADKAHDANAAKNAGKAYKDIAPSTGSLLSQYSGETPSEAEAYKMAARDGAGTADAAANGKEGRKKKTLLGGYYADSVLGG